ncbi:hypothetical protein [Spirosoma foliorum]|uniref:Uncharacterized protein n=1 Tax=Spirosoma foliorum TaxID=2710596 RepID=A0A7G5GS98_9BACT|nr:hypothetical protein [Spirosoma foliorum]QMW01740.1 hypothetical protein H3H32_27905 [Spirosoma foliorum]
MDLLTRFVPTRAQDMSFMAGVQDLLVPLYFNYFEPLSQPTGQATARALYQQDKIWFFNVFVVNTVDGRLHGQIGAGLNPLFDITSTSGMELPTGLFGNWRPSGSGLGPIVIPGANPNLDIDHQ